MRFTCRFYWILERKEYLEKWTVYLNTITQGQPESRGQSCISRTPNPPIGVAHAVTGGPKFQSRHHLAPQRKLRAPKLKYEALEISEVWGALKEKCITVISGPFERKVFTHYNCCWGPFWKWSSSLIHCSCCWAPFENKLGYFAHYSCKMGPKASAVLAFP